MNEKELQEEAFCSTFIGGILAFFDGWITVSGSAIILGIVMIVIMRNTNLPSEYRYDTPLAMEGLKLYAVLGLVFGLIVGLGNAFNGRSFFIGKLFKPSRKTLYNYLLAKQEALNSDSLLVQAKSKSLAKQLKECESFLLRIRPAKASH